MIVNPGQFQTLIIDKRKQYRTNEIFKTGFKEIKAASQVKLLGIEVGNKLNFEQHINRIGGKLAANKLNAIISSKRFLGFQESKVLASSFVLLNVCKFQVSY